MALSSGTARSAALAGVLLGSTTEIASTAEPASHAKPRAVMEFKSATPGETAWIGVGFDIDTGWHTYWRGASDSGQPIGIELKLPAGWTAGPIEWPAPHRLVQPGDILDYVYEKRVTLLIPVRVPKDAQPGREYAIEGSVTWLVCKDVCLPGKATLTWKIPAAGKPGDGAPGKSGDSGLFEEARKTLPHPLPAEKSPVNWRWQGDTLVLAAPGATGLTFYPDEKCATLADPIRQADANTETLSLDITKEKGLIGPVSGVVQIKRGAERPSDYYTILVPGPSGKKDPP